MTGVRMHEISTNYYTKYFTKWSGIGQENEFLATILGTEVDIDLHSLNNVNYVNKLKNSNMKNLHVDCLDQLILVVHLPDVSVANTNDCHSLL